MEISMYPIAIAFCFNFFYPFIYMCIFVFLSTLQLFSKKLEFD